MSCFPELYKKQGIQNHRSCATNIAEVMKEHGMNSYLEVTDPFNLFQNTPNVCVFAIGASMSPALTWRSTALNVLVALSQVITWSSLLWKMPFALRLVVLTTWAASTVAKLQMLLWLQVSRQSAMVSLIGRWTVDHGSSHRYFRSSYLHCYRCERTRVKRRQSYSRSPVHSMG